MKDFWPLFGVLFVAGTLVLGCQGESLETSGGADSQVPPAAGAPPGMAPGAGMPPAAAAPVGGSPPANPAPGTNPPAAAPPAVPPAPGAPVPTPGAPPPADAPPVSAPDCDPDDPWVGPGASEICGDWVDDDCDGEDAACPTTAASVVVPSWNCQGTPPAEVFAWAPVEGRVDACGVIFEAANAFYFAPINFDFVCPQRYQDRYFAWTTTEATCEPLTLVAYFDFDRPADFSQYGADFDYDRQPTSNACRKSLMFLAGDLPFSYVASDAEAVRDRLSLFPSLEVGCHEWTGTADFASFQFSKLPFVLQ